jgi:ATP/maltotriose-dependent transcriptional regulator MalT
MSLEALGDTYSSDGDHRRAMETYQRAFQLSADDATAHTRLAAKVGRAAFHRGVGTDADDWFNVFLDATTRVGATTASVTQHHMQQIRALWSTSRTSDILAISEPILDLAIASKNAELVLWMRLSLATVLHLLSRYDEARRYLEEIDVRTLPQADDVLCMYHRVCGFVHASSGNADVAFASFARALQHAEEGGDAYAYTSVLIARGMCATSLGRLSLAADSFLKALSTARENHHVWNIAYVSLEYARVLSRQGNRHLAHAYVNQALTFENPPPVLIEAFAEIGIPIAIECDDSHLLERCADEAALTFAFKSGEPPRLGPVASSFARYYGKTGKLRKAQDVLAKALDFVTSADQNYDLPLAVAELGERCHFCQARQILLSRTFLPNADVAVAHLHYFDALVLRRSGDNQGCLREATSAATLFRKLQWTRLETAAGLLADTISGKVRGAQIDLGTALDSFELSYRERMVAELVITGLSNREIAARLSITVRTVESHMTSLLSRMGLRSRHQLLESIRR